jgi:predicted RNA-binding protein YlqC (UPF0109 family)
MKIQKNMNNNLFTGTNTLTDNWLLQSVAEFLAGTVDPSMNWGWVSSDEKGVYYGQIKAGALQINCLTSILEQILFANNIFVMKEWVPVWYSLNTDLNLLYTNDEKSIIKELSVADQNIEKTKERWLNNILHTKKLQEKYIEGMKLYMAGKNSFWSQVINGVADYISLASSYNVAYAPHAARAGFLKSTLWYTSTEQDYPTQGIRTFNNLINRKRMSISEVRGFDSTLINLNVKIPSGSLLCIQKSSETHSPIKIALQLRNDPAIKVVRTMLHELSTEIAKKNSGEISNEIELINYLEEDIEKASDLLKIPRSIGGNDKCGNQILRQYNYEKYLNGGIIHKDNTISHSGILMDLIDTGSLQTRNVLEKKLKIDDHQIIKQLIDWNNPDFLKKIKEERWAEQYNVHIEVNGDNNVILGKDGNIINSIINQNSPGNMKDNTRTKNNPWISGSFYLVVAVIAISGLAVISNMVHWTLFPLIIFGGIIIISLVGILQLRNDNLLKDESFVKLLIETFKRLPIIMRKSQTKDDKNEKYNEAV